MPVDRYVGSAGGQPRLTIPYMNQFEDPKVNVAMRTIYTWANSLLMPSAGMPDAINVGTYTSDAPASPLTWIEQPDTSFEYVLKDNQSIVVPLDPDADHLSFTLMIVRVALEGPITSTDPTTASLILKNSSGTQIDGSYTVGQPSTSAGSFEVSPLMVRMISNDIDGGLPYTIDLTVQNIAIPRAIMHLVTWPVLHNIS